MAFHPELPIGVFDSGVGGLTVVRALIERLPHEHILYFGDTARVPYGVKSAETIRHYANQIADFLIERQVKLLIIACNTMAAVAVEAIRQRSPVPVLDVIEAGAESAAALTRNHHVGVIGTLATMDSGAYEHAIRRRHPEVTIHSHACPLFVPLVEEGWFDHPVTRLTAQEYLAPLLAAGIDTLVLGCTHYPLLQPLLQEVAGPGVTLVDSAHTTAELAQRTLAETRLLNAGSSETEHRYFVTDVPQRFRSIGERFLDRPLENLEIVRW